MKKENPGNFSDLKKEIKTSIDEHTKFAGWDGTIYNVTAVLAILLTSLAALLPSSIGTLYPKIISGIAAILITVDRALNWGGRWIYHRQMRHEYLNILAKISFYENMPKNFSEEEKKSHYLEIYTALYSTRQREDAMPGVKLSKG